MNRVQRGHPSSATSVAGAERADDGFFEALVAGDTDALESLLDDDFVLVDVFSGSAVGRDVLVGSIGANVLAFDAIDVIERATRRYGDVAVVVGRTAMTVTYDGTELAAASRYTHVLARAAGGVWRLVSAQGTPIAENPTEVP
jgi:ketosteroid isomerase-like protein